MGENALALPKAGFEPQKSTIKANSTLLSLVAPEHPLT